MKGTVVLLLAFILMQIPVVLTIDQGNASGAQTLVGGVPITAPMTSGLKSYDFNVTAPMGNMTVVGVRIMETSGGPDEVNETLYDNEGQTSQIAKDIAHNSDEDNDVSLILINGNELTMDKLFFLNVTQYNGYSGNVKVLMENDSVPVPGPSLFSGTFDTNNFFDTYTFSASVDMSIDIHVNVSTNKDLSLYIFPPAGDKYYPRSSAFKVAETNGEGLAEDVTFVATASGTYTAIVTNVGPLEAAQYNISFAFNGMDLVDGYPLKTRIDAKDTIEHYKFTAKKDKWTIVESHLDASYWSSSEFEMRLMKDKWTNTPELTENVGYNLDYGFLVVDGYKLSADTTYFLEILNLETSFIELTTALTQTPSALPATTTISPVLGAFDAGELTDMYQLTAGANSAVDVHMTVPTNQDYNMYMWVPGINTYSSLESANNVSENTGVIPEDISFISVAGGTYLIATVNADENLKSGDYTLEVTIDGRILTEGKTVEDTMPGDYYVDEYFRASAKMNMWNVLVQKAIDNGWGYDFTTEVYKNKYDGTPLLTVTDNIYDLDTRSVVINGFNLNADTDLFFRESGKSDYIYRLQYLKTDGKILPNTTTTHNIIINSTDLAAAYSIHLGPADSLRLDLGIATGETLEIYLFTPTYKPIATYNYAVATSSTDSTLMLEYLEYSAPLDGAGDYLILITNEGDLKTIDTELKVNVTGKDLEPPTMTHTPIEEYDPTEGAYIECTAIDNVEVTQVYLYYKTPTYDWYTYYMDKYSGNNTWYFDVGWLSGETDLWYYFSAEDLEENVATLPVVDPKTNAFHAVPIPDDEAPVITHFPTDSTIVGLELIITATIEDNVEVTEAKVFYRTKGSTSFTELDLWYSWWDWEATIPSTDIKYPALEYYIWATDGTNEVVSPMGAPAELYMVSTDTISPIIDISNVPKAYKAGENLDIIVHITDGGGIDTVVLYYKYKDEDTFMGWKTITMTSNGGGDYKATFKPESGKKSIQYYIRATDLASNSATQPMMGPLDPKTIEEEKSTVPNTVLGGSMVAIVVIILLVLIAVIAIMVIALRGKKDQVPPQAQQPMQPLPPAIGGVGYAPYQQSVVQPPPPPQAPPPNPTPPPPTSVPPSSPTPDERPPEGPPPDLPPGAWQAPYQRGPPPSY